MSSGEETSVIFSATLGLAPNKPTSGTPLSLMASSVISCSSLAINCGMITPGNTSVLYKCITNRLGGSGRAAIARKSSNVCPSSDRRNDCLDECARCLFGFPTAVLEEEEEKKKNNNDYE